MDYNEDIDVESMDKVSETLQEEIKQGLSKKVKAKWTKGSNVLGHDMPARQQKGSKLRPTPFTTLDEDAYYGDNSAGNLQIWIIVQRH